MEKWRKLIRIAWVEGLYITAVERMNDDIHDTEAVKVTNNFTFCDHRERPCFGIFQYIC